MAATAPRKTAEERREQILAIGLAHFAVGGYHGTSTEAIAREAGISQPYLFRLFRTKKALFLACYDRACDQIRDVFARAAAGVPREERLKRMGEAYVGELLADRDALLMQLQGYAATADPEIQAHARERYGMVVDDVRELSGADPSRLWDFFATGMALNVMLALDIQGEEWARRLAMPDKLNR